MKHLIYGLFAAAVLLPAASFDVASIKPSPPGSSGSDSNFDAGYLRMSNVTLRRCIRIAYQFPEARILEGPKWIDENRFEIVARVEHPEPGVRMQPYLQSLLADRFKLSLHHETRSLPGYALIIAKSGIKMKVAPPPKDEEKPNTRVGAPDKDGVGRTENYGHVTMSQFAARLADQLGAPVEDATGLEDVFSFTLTWSPEATQLNTAIADPAKGVSLLTAIQEQLGLRLESRKVPTDMLVIDHAEMPSEN